MKQDNIENDHQHDDGQTNAQNALKIQESMAQFMALQRKWNIFINVEIA